MLAPMPRTRQLLTAVAALALAIGIIGAPALASANQTRDAAPAPVRAITAVGLPSRSSDTSAFTFDSFDAVYTLGRTAGKHSTLRTVETLVAEFPAIDQNRGIIRAIPVNYDGHPTQIKILSVTDGTGAKRSYDAALDSNDDSFYDVTIAVPKGQFVHGKQSYVITYTQQDVTKYFSDTGDDEFYWDVNGTGWQQPFGEVSAKVTLTGSLASKLNGKTSCYYGPEGSTTPCELTHSGSDFSATQQTIGPHENVTVAIGFEKGTFAAASSNPLAYLSAAPIVGALLALIGVVLGWILGRFGWQATGTGIVIAQYEPPNDIDVMLAANIVDQPKRGFAASVVDLAVRGKIKLHERKAGFFGTEQFGVNQLDDSGLDDNEQSLLEALSFGSPSPEDGVTWLKKKDTTLGIFVRSLTTKVAKQTVTSGLRRKPPSWAFLTVLIPSGVGVALLAISGMNATNGVASTFGVIGAFVGGFAGLLSLGRVSGARPLTSDGAIVREKLDGLKLFIQLAEADRLTMLQSVTGAERTSDPDGTQVVKIYEKLLPYAVLFSLEKEWASTLGKYYDQNPPDWYDGGNLGTFQVAAFASGISSFSSSASSSYSGSAASSGSGGSGGRRWLRRWWRRRRRRRHLGAPAGLLRQVHHVRGLPHRVALRQGDAGEIGDQRVDDRVPARAEVGTGAQLASRHPIGRRRLPQAQHRSGRVVAEGDDEFGVGILPAQGQLGPRVEVGDLEVLRLRHVVVAQTESVSGLQGSRTRWVIRPLDDRPPPRADPGGVGEGVPDLRARGADHTFELDLRAVVGLRDPPSDRSRLGFAIGGHEFGQGGLGG